MSIRPYQPSDFDVLTILWRVSREKSLPDFQIRKGHFFFEDREFFQQHILVEDNVWVYQKEGILAAFMAMRADFIDHLYVHPDYWRQGIGSGLLGFARSLFPEHLWLYTLQVNRAACAFYEREGFIAERFGISPPPESEPDVEYHWRRAAGSGL